MKTLMAFLILLLFVMLQIRCSGKPTVFQTYFWTSHVPTEKLYLYVDDHLVGTLPYQPAAPDVHSDSLQRSTLYAQLPSGTYQVVVKNDQGQARVVEKLEVWERGGYKKLSTSFRDHQGGARCVMKDDRLVQEITY